MLIKIRRESIRPNPNVGQTKFPVFGRPTAARRGCWLLFDKSGSCQGLFEIIEAGADAANLRPISVSPVPYSSLTWMSWEYRVNYPVTYLYDQPQGKWLYQWEDPAIVCQDCQGQFSVSQLGYDSMELNGDDEDGGGDYTETNTKCPQCGSWHALGDAQLRYEQISEVPADELPQQEQPCVSDC